MPKIERTCETCGKIFIIYESQLKHDPCRFCSIKCRGIWQSKERVGKNAPNPKRAVECVCENCEAVFEVQLSGVKRGEGRFCSPLCWYEWNQGENHPLWRGGQHARVNPDYYRWRKSVLERDNYACRRCKTKEDLEAHHIIPFKNRETRWELGNGITLCSECHKEIKNQEEEFADQLFQMIELRI